MKTSIFDWPMVSITYASADVGLFAADLEVLDRATKGLQHEAVVEDGGAGHVKTDQFDVVHWKLSSAMAGARVIPRPPAPVTALTPRATCLRR